MKDSPLFTFLGFIWGFAIAMFIVALVIMPDTHDEQFKKDCSAMAHGTVSDKLCVNGSKILFHE